MRLNFIAGLFLGSAIVAVFTASLYGNRTSRLLEAEQRAQATERKLQATQSKLDMLLDLDEFRRKDRNAVNPNGVEVKPEDRIPAPKEPFPVAPVGEQD